jgi:hypothetical protein
MSVYITKSNCKRFVRKLDEVTLDAISEELYRRDIYFFSRRERANLKGIRELFRNPETFEMKYYKPIVTKDSLKYVFPETPPSYHKDNTCDRLNSNFKNYEIPVIIREKGAEEVLQFRKWFKENNCQSMNAKQYIEAIQRRFIYVGPINPATIERDNSGIEEKQNYSLESLENALDSILQDCDKFFDQNINLRSLIVTYQKWTFLAFTFGKIENNSSGLTDQELRSFLLAYETKFKAPVKNLLVEYYQLRWNPNMEFNGNLLDKMGFKPCKNCL